MPRQCTHHSRIVYVLPDDFPERLVRLEAGDLGLIMATLGDIARVRSMTVVAAYAVVRESGRLPHLRRAGAAFPGGGGHSPPAPWRSGPSATATRSTPTRMATPP